MSSVPLDKFFLHFTDEEETKIVAFFLYAIEEENKKNPERKNKNSISLRILPYEKAKHYLDRYKAHSNKDTTAYKFPLKEPITTNARFHQKLFEVIGNKRMEALTKELGDYRLYFTLNSWLKMKRNEDIIADLQEKVPDYKIERKYGITSDYVRQIRHRAKQAGKL